MMEVKMNSLVDILTEIKNDFSKQINDYGVPNSIDAKYRFLLRNKMVDCGKDVSNYEYNNFENQSSIKNIQFIKRHLCSRGFTGSIIELGCGHQSPLDYESIMTNDYISVDEVILNDICSESAGALEIFLINKGLKHYTNVLCHVGDFQKRYVIEEICRVVNQPSMFIMCGGTFGNINGEIRQSLVEYVTHCGHHFSFSFELFSEFHIINYSSRKYFHFLPLACADYRLEDFFIDYRFDALSKCVIGEATLTKKSSSGCFGIPLGTTIEIFRSQKFDEESVRNLVTTSFQGARVGCIYKSGNGGIAVIEPSGVR